MTKIRSKILSAAIAVGINLLPFQGLLPQAQAGGLNIPTKDQPQVLIILDNSQGMAGLLQATNSYSSATSTTPVLQSVLSGAIMTGSGVYGVNQASSSPPYYESPGFTPPALGSANGRNLYTVSCGTRGLTAAAQTSCNSVGNNGTFVDNSPSMLNAVESSLANVLSPTGIYAQNIQFGLATYKVGTPYLYNTWVYYMSGTNGFRFTPNANQGATTAVANPCYNQYSSSACNMIYNYFPYSTPVGTQDLFSSPTLYVNDVSDNPIINDVLYSTYRSVMQQNAVGQTPLATLSDFTLNDYESGNIQINYRYYSDSIASGASPTSAGYTPSSYQTWYSLRGLGYNASVSPDSASILTPITTNNSQNVQSILNQITPETFPAGNMVTASAGYAPVAGAFKKALSYLTSKQVPSTCGKKYVIFVTDGQPTMGLSGNVYPPLGSASAKALGVTSITASTWATTNNNAVVEAIQQIQGLEKNGIKTYVIGVGSAVNPNIPNISADQLQVAKQGNAVLTAMAQAGGTEKFYSALSQSDIQSALNSIVANILGKSVVSSYAAPPTVGVGSLEFLLKNVNPVTGQGDLYAYALTSNGTLSTNQSWTANQIMSAGNRTSNLYTTPLGGSPINGVAPVTFPTVATNSPAAFSIQNAALTPSIIAQYTIDPSYSNGRYLGGRQSGWFVGLPSSAPAKVLTAPNNAFLLSNSGYLSFAASHASRQNAVLFSDNDGFLYALGYTNTGTPTLLWGWMPGAFLPFLQNYGTFWQGANMGPFNTIDASPDGGKTWHTYVVGTGTANGAVIYDLQLSGKGAPNLQSVVSQYNLAGYAQPQASAPVYYQVQTPGANNYGATWALFALNNGSTSYLGVLNVTSGAGYLDKLPFTNTATPYLDANGNLYLGDSSGNIYEIDSTNVTSILNRNSSISIPSSQVITVLGTNGPYWPSSLPKQNIQYIGGTTYRGYNYLRVQTRGGIFLLQQQPNGNWQPVWASFAGIAGQWKPSFTPSTGGPNGITPLPSGSVVTDQALFTGGNVIVPVTIPPSSTDTCGVSTAAYYVFGIGNGIFPSGAFVSTDGQTITQGFVIGQGTAYTPSVTIFNGRTLLQGAASKNSTGGTKGFSSAFGAGLPVSGPIAWRIVVH